MALQISQRRKRTQRGRRVQMQWCRRGEHEARLSGPPQEAWAELWRTRRQLSLLHIAMRRRSELMFVQEPPEYLVPTRETTLCADGASCCLADWEAQPYWFKQLNSSMLTMDGQVYTTFYMMLNSNSAGCTGACCNFDISKIWVDVGGCRPDQSMQKWRRRHARARMRMGFLNACQGTGACVGHATPPVLPLHAPHHRTHGL
jgi:hypothetical protein